MCRVSLRSLSIPRCAGGRDARAHLPRALVSSSTFRPSALTLASLLSTFFLSFYLPTPRFIRAPTWCACTHVESNPSPPFLRLPLSLCARDDERAPLESFDIGDVDKYTEGRIYRIFFCVRSDGVGQTERSNREGTL